MDFHKILVYVVTGCLLVDDQVYALFNQTYGDITFILSDVSADTSQNKTSLTVAQNWCQSKGYTLAKIPDNEVQNYVQQFISTAVSKGLITGSELIILNGKLKSNLPGTWMWVNGQQIKNGVNIQDQPLDLSQGYFYGYLKTSDFKLHASTHHNGRPYICEKPGDCGVGGQSLNGRCYQTKTNSLTWYRARNDCVEEGGDLASFETLNDNTFNSTLGSTLLANASSTEYWVGIQRVEWRWEDTGLPIKYTKWEDGSPSNKPTEDCLSLRVTTTPVWLWYDYGCSQTCRFICMAINRTTLVPTIPISSTAVAKNASSTKSTSGSVIPAPTSPSLSVQPASNSAASYDIPTANDSPLALGLGLGIGLGVGAILVVAIVLGVIFMRRKQNRKRNDARRDVNAPQSSTLQQTSSLSSTSETSRKPNQKSSPNNGIQLGRTTGDTTQTYETLQSADGRSPESPYQQLDLYETLN